MIPVLGKQPTSVLLQIETFISTVLVYIYRVKLFWEFKYNLIGSPYLPNKSSKARVSCSRRLPYAPITDGSKASAKRRHSVPPATGARGRPRRSPVQTKHTGRLPGAEQAAGNDQSSP